MADIIPIHAHTWAIADGMVRFYLLEGTRQALLIDTGMNTPDARRIAESLTDKPLQLLNTHADPDHISGNAAFNEFYMSPAEWGNYHDSHGGTGRLLPVAQGDTLDLGDRPLVILALPGHTPGSIAVLDVKARALFSGDPIQDGQIYMFGPWRDLGQYVQSLSTLWENHRGSFDLVYPAHGTTPLSPGIIPGLIAGAKAILAGSIPGQPRRIWGSEIRLCDVGCAVFLCSPETEA